jgi:transcriptional regulator with XRE-family HTH domain
MAHMSGLDLKLKRIAAGVKALDVAAQMGITGGRLSRIESQPVLTANLEARYLTALAACIDRVAA